MSWPSPRRSWPPARPTEAMASLDQLSGAVEQTAEYLYQCGATVACPRWQPARSGGHYTNGPSTANARHPGVLFGLALENDRRGNDETALDLYQRAAAQFPAHIGSLLNLGILYEDRQQYERARQCYQRILENDPNHPRARLFFRDAQAAGDMFYDEDAQRRRDRLESGADDAGHRFRIVGSQPKLPEKMGVIDPREWPGTSEQELLASKNFGETSLGRDQGDAGLEGIGNWANWPPRSRPWRGGYEPEVMSPDEQALLSRPIADLNLSVRARKCMIRLGISTIGDLVRRTGDELLECKTLALPVSNEVREKLTGARHQAARRLTLSVLPDGRAVAAPMGAWVVQLFCFGDADDAASNER